MCQEPGNGFRREADVDMNDIVKRVNFRLKHLSTFRYVLKEDVKKGLVDALVQPIFDYGDVVCVLQHGSWQQGKASEGTQ
jgi:hypothetical protein